MLRVWASASRVSALAAAMAALLIMGLAIMVAQVDDRMDTVVDTARQVATHELSQLFDAAREQSAAFAGTSFVGYSVGRYYGFASAYAQISPNPDRATALLRQAFGPDGHSDPGDTGAALAPALAPYMAVYDRFNASFTDMISSSVFDDLYLIDRFGHVVYTLRKGGDLGRDLNAAAGRQTPLGVLYHDIDALVAKAADPSKVFLITPPQRLEGGTPGMLVGRPVVRYGALEGMVAFRLPLSVARRRLEGLHRPGIRLRLIDGAGAPLDDAGAGAVYGTYVVGGTGWRVQALGDGRGLAGPWGWLVAAMALATALVLAWAWVLWRAGLLRGTGAGPLDGRRVLALFRPGRGASHMAAPRPSPVALPTPAVPPAPPPPATPPVVEAAAPGGTPVGAATDLDASEEFRQCIVDVMTLTLDFWHQVKRKGKIELAEESGLWRVYMDRSSLQTRTLDKYLLVETLPRNPRWRDVVRTAEFVLRHCPDPDPARDGVREALTRLKQHLRQAERI